MLEQNVCTSIRNVFDLPFVLESIHTEARSCMMPETDVITNTGFIYDLEMVIVGKVHDLKCQLVVNQWKSLLYWEFITDFCLKMNVRSRYSCLVKS